MDPQIPILLLPGMDGTGDLFDWILASCPVEFEPSVVRYSRDHVQTLEDLVSLVIERLPARPCVILAESFSCTVAIKVAARHQDRIKALVLCNAFVRSPAPTVARLLPWSWLLRRSPPMWFLRRYLVGQDASPELIGKVSTAIRSVKPSVLAARLRSSLSEDVGASFRRLSIPVLYLRGTSDYLVSQRSVDHVFSLRPDIHAANIAGPHLLLQAAREHSWHEIRQFLLAV